MDYARHYERLIARSIGRLKKAGLERHHIRPKCLGGLDDPGNLVFLLPREHFFAHLLLVKMHPGIPGLTYAVMMMRGNRFRGLRTSNQYAWARQRAIAFKSAATKGVKRPRSAVEAMIAATRGRPKSDETKAKLSLANKGRKVADSVKARIAESLRGRKKSPEACQRQSAATRGVPKPGCRGNRSRTGMTNSPECRQKIGAAHRGKIRPSDWRLNISMGQADISDEVIRKIRADYRSGGISQTALAIRYGLGQSHVSRIVRGQCYAWVKDAA